MLVRDTVWYPGQEPGGFQDVLRIRRTPFACADESLKIMVVLTVNIVSGDTKRTLAARVQGHHDYTIAHLYTARLCNGYHFSRRFVAEKPCLVSSQESFVFRAHRGHVNLDYDPILSGLWVWNLYQSCLTLSENYRFLHKNPSRLCV